MACGCQKNRKQYEVVLDDGAGRVVYTSTSEPTAKAVARRYNGSIVREKGSKTT